MKKIYIIAILSLCTTTIIAQWQKINGPYGGTIKCISTDGANTLVGTSNGMFLSSNNCASWTSVSSGIPEGLIINTCAVSGTNLFAGSMNGLFFSNNNGNNWALVGNGLNSNPITSIAISGSKVFASNYKGVFLSTDFGGSWTSVNNGFVDSSRVTSIAISGNNILAGTLNGVYISSNDGGHWTVDSTGMTLPYSTFVSCLATSGSNIYAGTHAGIYLSTNNGSSWFPINNGLTNHNISSIVASNQNIFAVTNHDSIFLLTNNGGLWVPVNMPTNSWINSLATTGTNLFAATDDGVYVSVDTGSSWTSRNIGIRSYGLNCLGTDGTILYAAAPFGKSNVGTTVSFGTLLVSNDNGNNWSELGGGAITSLYATGTNIYAGGPNGAAVLSTVIGSNWISLNNANLGESVTSIIRQGSYLYAATPGGVYVSTNNGAFWNPPIVLPGAVTALAANATTLLAGTSSYGDLYGSGVPVSALIPFTGRSFPSVRSIVLNGNIPIIGTTNGVYSGTSNPNFYNFSSLNGANINSLVKSGTIYLAATSKGVFISTNAGSTWTSVNDGLMDYQNVVSIVVIGTNVFAGIKDGNIFIRSLNDLLTYQTSVWPGDANHDSIADNNDLLPIGIHYSESGIARSSISNLWQANACANWGVIQSNFADLKHVDCNGDGIINSNDTLAIGMNMNLMHTLVQPNNISFGRQITTDMYFVTNSNTYHPGDWVDVELWLGTSSFPVNNLYGIAFDINYDASLVQSGTEIIIYPDSNWLAKPGADAINLSKINRSLSTAFGAETRIFHDSRNGYGKIADFKFQILSDITSPSNMEFSVSHYQANDAFGGLVNFNPQAYSINLTPMATGIENTNSVSKFSVYPNPYSGSTQIKYSLNEKSDVIIEIYNSIGQKLETIFNGRQGDGEYNYTFSAKEKGFEAGLYFVKFEVNGLQTMKKIIELK